MTACPNLQEHLILAWCWIPHRWGGCWWCRDKGQMPALCVPQGKLRSWEVEQSSSAMAIFCLQILCVTTHIPQRFCPVFYSKRKGHTMWFCHCLMHRTILHRLRIQVFSKLTLASCTRRSQGLSSPKFRSDWVIQAGRDSKRSKHSTSCSKQGYISWKHNGHQSLCLNYILHRKWRQWLNLSALH